MRRLLRLALLVALSPLTCLAWPGTSAAVSPPPVEASQGMVVTAQHYASEIGVEILKAGGNAVDAAVAVGYALAVVHPCCGNLGGGGFATLHLADGRDSFLDFREKAPEAATETMYLDAAGNVVPGLSLRGYKAVGVPGTVLGLETLRQRYGTMTRARLMAPAIALARDGYLLTKGDAEILKRGAEAFAGEPNVAAIFLNGGRPWQAGERLVQKDLAATLGKIEKDGADAFYKGPIAAAIVAASRAHGGLLTLKDFADYTVPETAPLRCGYRGYEILSSPPPSSGGTTLCEILGVLEGYPMARLGFHSAAAVHLMVEAMRHAYVDRNFSLGDPAFVDNPVAELLSPAHLAAIRQAIEPEKATPSSAVRPGVPPHEGTQTTHFSIVDKDGNAVSLTYTINAFFGAKVIAGDTGFFLNDEMDDFTSKPGVPNLFGLVQGKANAIAPGKRPLSSMSPTIVTKDGKVFLVVGSPGGSRIITITLEAILNVVDHGMDIQAAIDAPRIHHQWLPDKVFVEPYALSPDTRAKLAAMGYDLVEQRGWGAAEGIEVGSEPDPAGGAARRVLYGANDDRRPAGAAAGY
ncbi:gamma-glutamyltransferase 1 Threonine peptidase. MEROPS family T03 [Tistlia consotensis]|uniref:Glutathione hydrolase proenzyme n=1 Tax=Tistlia consotensis USBA 355 TaxID=560819 RepID=A0A1Y6CSB0_9PROT|nr:gamma-glutamyltransferase [Tistlia consotensis]SMF69766.1 gamma-glutamyltransferase 1 Threonine peptidase. MEROPS family T03 [Tistlia consotensis USBA 355]SNS05370.1 gamma-glutamyltransferase 1 Threonine peptidase. MEROPS family T03 [Tistlia consotensis]